MIEDSDVALSSVSENESSIPKTLVITPMTPAIPSNVRKVLFGVLSKFLNGICQNVLPGSGRRERSGDRPFLIGAKCPVLMASTGWIFSPNITGTNVAMIGAKNPPIPTHKKYFGSKGVNQIGRGNSCISTVLMVPFISFPTRIPKIAPNMDILIPRMIGLAARLRSEAPNAIPMPISLL